MDISTSSLSKKAEQPFSADKKPDLHHILVPSATRFSQMLEPKLQAPEDPDMGSIKSTSAQIAFG